MKLNHPAHLNLLFPQWQGSGPSNILFYGANSLADACPDIDFVPIPVPEEERLQISHGILGYGAIVSQLVRVKETIEQANPKSIMVIGGDCGVELAPVSFMNRVHGGNLALVWLDAHSDLNTPASSPSKHFHGMPLRALCGEGEQTILDHCFSFLSPRQVILAGARQFDPAEQQFIQDHAITQVFIQEMVSDPGSITRRIREKGFDNVYIHIDMDVLDPGEYPHVKHPTPHGLTLKTLEKILLELASSFHVAGLGLMEFTADNMTLPGKLPLEKDPQTKYTPGLAGIKRLMDIFR
jgi:arginase